MLSYLSTGFPEAASERARLLGLIISWGSLLLLVCIGLLAFKPSWPLAAGTAAAAVVMGYMFRIASRHGTA